MLIGYVGTYRWPRYLMSMYLHSPTFVFGTSYLGKFYEAIMLISLIRYLAAPTKMGCFQCHEALNSYTPCSSYHQWSDIIFQSGRGSAPCLLHEWHSGLGIAVLPGLSTRNPIPSTALLSRGGSVVNLGE